MRLLRGLATVLAIAAAVASAGCGGGGETRASRPAEAAGARTGEAGVSVELPPGWHAGAPADGNVVDPLTRLVASSARVKLREVPCQIARYAPPPSEVTLVVVEWKSSADADPGPRPPSFTREALPLQPPPAIECFEGSGGSVQFVEQGRVFGAYLLAGTRAPERLIREAREVLNGLTVESRPPARRLNRNGVSIAIPTGWDGRMLFRDAAGSGGVIFQVGNFELPSNEGFEPPQELPPGEEDPIKAMDAGDVLITVVSDEPTGEPAPEPITVDQLRFLPQAAPRVPRGHTLAERSFCYGARCVRIEIDFGGELEPALTSAVNHVLASLAVAPAAQRPASASGGSRGGGDPSPRGCPRENWPGPWTACAEAEWLRRVAQEGGYRIVGDTGSALIAEGKGRSFYVWTTPARREADEIAAEAGNWRRLAVIDGIPIYGDDELWRFWQAQAFTFWVKEGPRGDSIVPAPVELATLVQASTIVPPPAR